MASNQLKDMPTDRNNVKAIAPVFYAYIVGRMEYTQALSLCPRGRG